jgi:hypothetical protein
LSLGTLQLLERQSDLVGWIPFIPRLMTACSAAWMVALAYDFLTEDSVCALELIYFPLEALIASLEVPNLALGLLGLRTRLSLRWNGLGVHV